MLGCLVHGHGDAERCQPCLGVSPLGAPGLLDVPGFPPSLCLQVGALQPCGAGAGRGSMGSWGSPNHSGRPARLPEGGFGLFFFFSGSWRGGMEEEKVRSCFFHCPTTLQWGFGTGELRSRLGAVPTALRGCIWSEVQSPWWLRSPDGTVVGHAASQTPPCPGPARAGTKLPVKAKPFPKPPR